MASTLTERINKLTNKIERWDQQIAEFTHMREQAAAEIVELVGGTVSGAKTTPSYKPVQKGKLGDKILALLQVGDGLSRDTIAGKLKTEAQKVSLSLYHLVTRGSIYESNGQYFLPMQAKTTPPTDDNTD